MTVLEPRERCAVAMCGSAFGVRGMRRTFALDCSASGAPAGSEYAYVVDGPGHDGEHG